MIDIGSFAAGGFVRVEEAFPREPADECRAVLRRNTGRDPGAPAAWTRPRLTARPPLPPSGPLPAASPVRVAIGRGPGRF